MRPTYVLCSIMLIFALTACASRPINPPIAKIDLNSGYRPYLMLPKRQNNDPSILMVLSFSGGGTRAAAFSYGVLEELRRTPVTVQGQQRRLLDEVDIITGVSGGSFTALAYSLYGERLFSEYETRFLKRNVQGVLIGRTLNPFNWWKFIGGSAGRSELAAQYYDEILFNGPTFGDLLDKPGPVALAIGTDLSTGSRLIFYQQDFDLLCSDLNKVNLSRAAATSSAVPVALSPVTFNNYGGTCDYEYPFWVKDVVNAKTREGLSSRALERYSEMESFQNSTERPYIHLVDGGVSDNIGVRPVLDTIEELEASSAFSDQVGFAGVERIVLIVVDSHSSPPTHWDTTQTPPGFVIQLLQSTSVPIEKYSFDTVEIMKGRTGIMARKRDLKVAYAQLAGASKAEAEASIPKLTLEVITVSFDEIHNPKDRAHYMGLPTSFSLPAEDIDGLRSIAGQLLRASEDYKALVHSFNQGAKMPTVLNQ